MILSYHSLTHNMGNFTFNIIQFTISQDFIDLVMNQVLLVLNFFLKNYYFKMLITCFKHL